VIELIKMDMYKRPDGFTDFIAYSKAQIANGEICQDCKEYLIFPKGYPCSCGSCQSMLEPEEVQHDKFIRCPSCQHKWDPYEGEDYDVLADGDHNVYCPECDHKFSVSTSVSYTFTSPKTEEKELEGSDEQ